MTSLTHQALSRRAVLRMAGVGVAGVAGASLLAACGGDSGSSSGGDGDASDSQIRASWFGGDDRHARTQEAFEIIEGKIEGLTVATEPGGFEGYFDKVITQISGGNAPDLVQTNFPLSSLAARDALTDLTEYIDNGLDLSGIPELDREGGYWDGKLYGVSLGTVVPASVVDTVTLPAGITLPDTWTWEEYAQVADEIAQASGGAVAGTEDGSSYGQGLDAWAMARGKEGQFTREGQVALDVTDVEEWLEYWDALRRSGGCVPIGVQAPHNNGDHPTNPVVLGKAVLAVTQYNTTIGVWSTITPNALAYHTIPGGDHPTNFARPSSMWSVPRGTQDVDLAVRVIDLFINDPDCAIALGFSRATPNRHALEAIGDNLSDADRALQDFTTSVLEGALAPAAMTPPSATEAGPALKRAAESVAFGDATIADAAKAFVAELEGMQPA